MTARQNIKRITYSSPKGNFKPYPKSWLHFVEDVWKAVIDCLGRKIRQKLTDVCTIRLYFGMHLNFSD